LNEAVVAYFKILSQPPPIETGESTGQFVSDRDSNRVTAEAFDSFRRKGQRTLLNRDQFIVFPVI
jgi:hypothetical protein